MRTRAFILATVLAGGVAAGVAVIREAPHFGAILGCLAAAAIVGEYFEVRGDARSLDGGGSYAFSFSSGIHIAAVLLLGPWAAVIVAVAGVVAVDCVRSSEFRRLAFNASAFALSALAAGWAYVWCGGVPGALALPHDFGAIVLMSLAYVGTNRGLVAAIIALTSSAPFRHGVGEALRADLGPASAELSIGLAIAFFVLSGGWELVVLGPLVFAVYQAHARLAHVHYETARALETFASVVDERDPFTSQHSQRVAESVGRFAERIGVPNAEVARLRWAARLHDLGKVAVDVVTLHKQGALDPAEWELMRRHPRLSARLLRRFRLATAAAQAVEYHHERYDGTGYYGVAGSAIPLAAHLLIVADSYDAMISDRPYRPGLDREEALAAIAAGSGTQFHPLVAKAFVNHERGHDPLTGLTPAEAAELRALSLRPPRSRLLRTARHEELVITGLVAAFAAAGAGRPVAALPGLLASLAASGFIQRRERVRRRLAAVLREALEDRRQPSSRFSSFVERLGEAAPVAWAAVLRWDEQRLTASVAQRLELTDGGPELAALESWLIREREADSAVLIAEGKEFGAAGIYVVAPVELGGSLGGFVVLAFASPIGSSIELALHDASDSLEQLLAPVSSPPRLRLAAAL